MGLRDDIMWVLFFSIIILIHNSHISATYTNLENHPGMLIKPICKYPLLLKVCQTVHMDDKICLIFLTRCNIGIDQSLLTRHLLPTLRRTEIWPRSNET